MIRIVEYWKPNGVTRFNVLVGDRQVGQFYSRTNAERFVEREVLPALMSR